MLSKTRSALSSHHVRWRVHAQQRMLERGILRKEVVSVVQKGAIIEEYLNDESYPSFLIHHYVNGRHLHAVIGFNESDDMVYVITVYEPDAHNFKADYITRRTKQ